MIHKICFDLMSEILLKLAVVASHVFHVTFTFLPACITHVIPGGILKGGNGHSGDFCCKTPVTIVALLARSH